jgi:hypothetical protein
MPAFARYIGIDYSGAQTPTSSLKGLRMYLADGSAPPVEMQPSSPRGAFAGMRRAASIAAAKVATQLGNDPEPKDRGR